MNPLLNLYNPREKLLQQAPASESLANRIFFFLISHMAWHEQVGLFSRLTDIFYFFVFLSWAGSQMENRSFMFLCFLKEHHWERKCQHSSLQLANNERQLSGNQELSSSSEHLAGVCYGQTKPQGFGDHLVTRGDRWDTLLQVTKTHTHTHTHTHTSLAVITRLVQLACVNVNL